MTIFWLAAFFAFSIGEAVTVGLVSVWFAVGALAGLFATALGAGLWLQITVFLGVSALALTLFKSEQQIPQAEGLRHQRRPGDRRRRPGHRDHRQHPGPGPGEGKGADLVRPLRPGYRHPSGTGREGPAH